MDSYENLLEYLEQLTIIDTHYELKDLLDGYYRRHGIDDDVLEEAWTRMRGSADNNFKKLLKSVF